MIENLELENLIVSTNHDRIYELRIRYLREQLNYAKINNINDASLMEYEYIDMPYFYKGAKNIEAEINDLQASLKSYDYIPEIVNNKMLINRIKDLDLYKFVNSDLNEVSKDERIIFYDLDNILITEKATNKLYDITLLFYSILFSFLFSLFVAFLLYSYQRHLFNRNN